MTEDVIKILINYVAVPSVVTTILVFVLKKYLSNKVDNYFQEKITLFKHQLDLSTEAERFNYQRKIQDFNLYTVKKHEKYVSIYESILEAESRICGIYGFKSVPTYQEYNENDIRKIMTDEKFPEGKINEIFEIWRNQGKDEALKTMRKFFRLIEVQKASNSFNAFKYQYIISKLYLSETIDKKITEIIGTLAAVLAHYETFEQLPFEARREMKEEIKEATKLQESVRPQIEELTELLKKELAVGYYN